MATERNAVLFDETGRLVSRVFHGGTTTIIRSEEDDDETSPDSLAGLSAPEDDVSSDPARRQDPDGPEVQFSYDQFGELADREPPSDEKSGGDSNKSA